MPLLVFCQFTFVSRVAFEPFFQIKCVDFYPRQFNKTKRPFQKREQDLDAYVQYYDLLPLLFLILHFSYYKIFNTSTNFMMQGIQEYVPCSDCFGRNSCPDVQSPKSILQICTLYPTYVYTLKHVNNNSLVN